MMCRKPERFVGSYQKNIVYSQNYADGRHPFITLCLSSRAPSHCTHDGMSIHRADGLHNSRLTVTPPRGLTKMGREQSDCKVISAGDMYSHPLYVHASLDFFNKYAVDTG